MKKKGLIFLPAVLAAVLLFGITAMAHPPWIVPKCGICGEVKEYGEHLWHSYKYHDKDYSENGQLKTERCLTVYNEDREWLVCPNGHGTLWKGRHHKETHSSSHCQGDNRDYYITE